MPAKQGWDVHTHLVPRSIVEAARGEKFSMAVIENHLVTPMLRIPLRRITNANVLTQWVDHQALAGALVSIPPPLFRPELDAKDRARWTSLVNDGLAEMCDDQRLRSLAYVPAEDPGAAVEVVAGLADDWAGVVMGTDLSGRVYSDPNYEALWCTLVERNLAIFIHPGVCSDVRLSPFYLSNLVGNPYETSVAAAHLVLGDVIGRHPELKFVLAHGGGATAAMVGRWQRGVSTQRPGLGPLTLTPIEAASLLRVDSLVHSAAYLDTILDTFGPDRVLFGSDWPFPMGTDSVEESLASQEAGARRRILVDNALDTFNL